MAPQVQMILPQPIGIRLTQMAYGSVAPNGGSNTRAAAGK
jgi:hypothetical protein